MKILKVEFENINSLAGHWCIDFQDESYQKAHNIFVICGPTGAGKTTILDAITLGIFGKTPRQSKVSKKENEIMTRETSNCFSRVTYQCETGTYISEWFQRYGRAVKGKPSKKQDPEYKVSRIANDGSLEIVSEGKQTNNALEVENSKIIKLDYTQFCRSIMLAQGEFSKFLTSNNDDRAAILEKLDGSGKYRKIATRIYDRFRKEKEIYNNLRTQIEEKQSSMKTQEELNQLIEEKQLSNSELKALEENSKKNDSLLNWYKEHEKLEVYQNHAEKEFQRASNNSKEFEHEKLTLKRAIEAKNCEASYESNKKLHSDQETDEITLAKNKKDEITFTAQKKDYETKLEALKSNLEELKSSFEKSSELFKAIRQVDINIANAEKEKIEKENLKDDVNKELSQLKTLSVKYTKDLEAHKKDLTEKKLFIEIHKNDEKIAASLPDIKLLGELLKTTEKDISTNKKTVVTKEKELAVHNTQLNKLLTNEQSLLNERSKLIEDNITVIVDVLQENLSDGIPCPVCGSKNHPYCDNNKDTVNNKSFENDEKVTDITKRLKEIIKQLENTTAQKNNHSVLINSLTNEINDLKEKIITAQNTLENGIKQLEDLVFLWHAEKFELSEIDGIYNELNKRSIKFVEIQKAIEKLETSISTKEEALSDNIKSLKEKEEKYQEYTDNFNKTVQTLNDLKKKRADLFGDKSVDDEEKAAKNQISNAEKEINKYSEKEKEISEKLSRIIGTISSLSENISKREKEINESDKVFVEKLKENNFENEEAMINSILSMEKINALQEREKSIYDSFIKAKQSLEDANKNLENHKQEQPSIEAKNEIIEKQKLINNKIEDLRTCISQIESILAVNEKNQSEYQELAKRYEAQKATYARWELMQSWTGQSNGSDFSVFVQSITFKYLLKLANKHLSQMKDRYKLQSKEDLGFEIVDSYYAEPRPDSNISGGEKFLVSLALALGIAEFASKNVRIDSLFLDEGFGSLDSEVLNDVLTCLKREQKNGKLLGIITHVDAVVQSIDQRIEVIPTTKGHSKITGPGVTKVE